MTQAGVYNSSTGTCRIGAPENNFHAHDCATEEEEDNDGDGQTVSEGDCDDTDSTIYLGAPLEYDDTPCEYAFPLGQDRNCNNIDDAFETCSPIVIDVSGNGFELTDAAGGVEFDLNRNGVKERLA